MGDRVEEALAVLKAPGVLTDELKRELFELLVFPPERRKMSYEEFLAWAGEDTLAEWVEGEMMMYSPASKRHQEIAGFLYRLMGSYVESRELGMVLQPPFQIKLAHSGREPDLIFIATEHLDRLRETYLDGPADLVVEVISPESIARDRGDKFYEYEEAGIPEYWLIDPERERAEFHHLDEQERYGLVFGGREGVFRSEVLPGFWLRVEWLWQEPLPSPVRAVAEIAGVEAALIEAFEKALRGA